MGFRVLWIWFVVFCGISRLSAEPTPCHEVLRIQLVRALASGEAEKVFQSASQISTVSDSESQGWALGVLLTSLNYLYLSGERRSLVPPLLANLQVVESRLVERITHGSPSEREELLPILNSLNAFYFLPSRVFAEAFLETLQAEQLAIDERDFFDQLRDTYVDFALHFPMEDRVTDFWSSPADLMQDLHHLSPARSKRARFWVGQGLFKLRLHYTKLPEGAEKNRIRHFRKVFEARKLALKQGELDRFQNRFSESAEQDRALDLLAKLIRSARWRDVKALIDDQAIDPLWLRQEIPSEGGFNAVQVALSVGKYRIAERLRELIHSDPSISNPQARP